MFGAATLIGGEMHGSIDSRIKILAVNLFAFVNQNSGSESIRFVNQNSGSGFVHFV